MNLQYTLSKAVAVALITGSILLSGFLGTFLIGCHHEGPRSGYAAVTDRLTPLVLEVRTPGLDGDTQSSGSCVVIDRRGYLLTCFHVVDGSPSLLVDTDTGPEPASVFAFDPYLDLAIIHVNHGFPHAVTWGDSSTVLVGDRVVDIGFPFHLTKTASYGFISSLEQVISYPVLQTDAAINPGCSGGGLFDVNGALIGIAHRLYAAQGLSANVGISWAIPSNVAHLFVLRNLP